MIWILVKDLDPPEIWPYERLKVPKIENEALKKHTFVITSHRRQSQATISDEMNKFKVYKIGIPLFEKLKLVSAKCGDFQETFQAEI